MVLLAAAVATAFSYSDTSSAESVSATLEAETFSIPAGGSVYADDTASNGQALLLTTNGTATKQASTPAAARLEVRAKGCWRPYADSSPFNQPLPATPRISANSSNIVSRLLGFGSVQHVVAGQAGTKDDYAAPVYYSRSTDPLFTIHCTRYACPSIEGTQIRIPQSAQASGGPDAHMIVIDQATGWEYDLYKYCWSNCANSNVRTLPQGGRDVYVGSGGKTLIAGSGAGLSGGGATAANFGRFAGIIRPPEWQEATMAKSAIDHALYMVAYCDDATYVYPANKSGRSRASINLPNTNAPLMGTRFQLNYTETEINALGVPEWKKVLLRAMARYGLYFGDTGSGSWAIQAESGSSYTSFGYEDLLITFAKSQPGVILYNDQYVFKVHDGVDWSRLRVIDPCVTQKTC